MGEYIINRIPTSQVLELMNKISSLIVEDDAKLAHDRIERFLVNEGYNCVREYRVSDRGDGTPGRIDLFVFKEDIEIGIEIDNTMPRGKSIFKLNTLDSNVYKIVILRNYKGEVLNPPENLDAIITIDLLNTKE